MTGATRSKKASRRSLRFARRALTSARASARREREEGWSAMHGLPRRFIGSLKGQWHKVRLPARKSSFFVRHCVEFHNIFNRVRRRHHNLLPLSLSKRREKVARSAGCGRRAGALSAKRRRLRPIAPACALIPGPSPDASTSSAGEGGAQATSAAAVKAP